METVRLDSIMISMICSLKDMIASYKGFQRAQNEGEVQIDNKKIIVMPGKLYQLSSANQGKCTLPIFGWRSPTYGICWNIQTLPSSCLRTICPEPCGYLLATYPKKWKILLGRRAGIKQDISECGFFGYDCQKYMFLFQYGENQWYYVDLLRNFSMSYICN